MAILSLETSPIEGTPGSTCSEKFWEKNVKNGGFRGESGSDSRGTWGLPAGAQRRFRPGHHVTPCQKTRSWISPTAAPAKKSSGDWDSECKNLGKEDGVSAARPRARFPDFACKTGPRCGKPA